MKYVYTLEMLRWADRENHSYCSGVYSTLIKALDAGIRHSLYRSTKYEPYISMHEIDSSGPMNTVCRDIEQARKLYLEITGSEWKETEEVEIVQLGQE